MFVIGALRFFTHFLTFSARSAEQKLEMEVQPSQNPLKQTNLLFCRTSRSCNHNRVSAQMMELQHGKAKRSLLELSIHDWLIATTPRFVWRFFKWNIPSLMGRPLVWRSFLLLRVGRVGWWRGLFGRGGVLGKMGNQNLLKHCLLFGFLATPGYRGWAHLHKYVWQPPIENLHGTRKMIASEQILLFQGSMFRFHIDFPGMKSI